MISTNTQQPVRIHGGYQYDTWLELVEHAGEHGSPILPLSENSKKQSGPIHKCETCSQEPEQVQSLKDHVHEHREMVFLLVRIVKKLLKSILA